MAAAGALGVIGVNRAALERLDRFLDETGFVERVGVNSDLHIELVGDAEAGVDRGGRSAPIFVEFQADGAGQHLVAQRLRRGAVAFAEEAKVDRVGFGGFEHAVQVPPAGRARGGEGAVRRAGAAADQCGDAGADGLVDLLRADEMDMRESMPPAVTMQPSAAMTSVPAPTIMGFFFFVAGSG